MEKIKILLYLLVLSSGASIGTATAQCTLTLSSYNEAAVISCLTSCGCSEVVIPTGTTVNMDGDWDLTGQGVITFTIQGTGSLVFSGAGVNRDELYMTSGSVLIIEDTNNTTAIASDPPSGGQPRITIGSTLYKGNDFDAIIAAGGADENGPLPIELIYFGAKVVNQKVELNWATASEENFNYFSIERSFDGKNFSEIAQITGNGSSYQRLDYSYTDKFPAIGISYYRLRSIDFDGYTEVFDYVIVNVEGVNHRATVYPNPASNLLNVQLNFDLKEAQILFYNSMGHQELSLSITSWLNPLDISGLHSGSYLIKIITSKEVLVKRILVK